MEFDLQNYKPLTVPDLQPRECRTPAYTTFTRAGWVFFLPRAEGSEAALLAEVYTKLEEIEADKAPAR